MCCSVLCPRPDRHDYRSVSGLLDSSLTTVDETLAACEERVLAQLNIEMVDDEEIANAEQQPLEQGVQSSQGCECHPCHSVKRARSVSAGQSQDDHLMATIAAALCLSTRDDARKPRLKEEPFATLLANAEAAMVSRHRHGVEHCRSIDRSTDRPTKLRMNAATHAGQDVPRPRRLSG